MERAATTLPGTPLTEICGSTAIPTTPWQLLACAPGGILANRDTEIQTQTGIRPPFALEAFTDIDDDVRQSMARVRHSPFLPHRDQVRSFVLEVDDGSLREIV